jgi:UDP-N-acetylmuramyl pentapeptide phosphotransferase/UDP-N-acetylglucosamine-1-phosphate transferase
MTGATFFVLWYNAKAAKLFTGGLRSWSAGILGATAGVALALP